MTGSLYQVPMPQALLHCGIVLVIPKMRLMFGPAGRVRIDAILLLPVGGLAG
jgi:hypothetical protein